MRLPRSHENPLRTSCDQPSTQKRTCSSIGINSVCLSLGTTFPKAARLLKKADFTRVSKSNLKLYTRSFGLGYSVASHPGRPRLGLAVSKKYGNSPERNLFKRMMRESFRLLQDELCHSFSKGILYTVWPLKQKTPLHLDALMHDWREASKLIAKSHPAIVISKELA